MTSIILQSRLDSSRLPRKALLDLAGKPVLVRVMENLRRIKADQYILACDSDSQTVFTPLAESCGFTCIGGPKEDVLERFCQVIRQTGTMTVLRATGDNPFLFADAAEASLARFAEFSANANPVNSFTYVRLPHGSGIEVFSGRSLLEAAALTESPYDHEHVGPALYNHPERFNCVREPAPADWYHPDLRTTIDTVADYDRAILIAEYILSRQETLPANSALIVEAWKYISRPLLFIPSTTKSQGSGHWRRIEGLVERLAAKWRCLVYIPSSDPVVASLFTNSGISIVHELPDSAHLVILDRFRTTNIEMESYRAIGPVVAIDEGGTGREAADFLLDIIPGIPGRFCKPNQVMPSLLPLPQKRRMKTEGEIVKVLVIAGGENVAQQALPCARALAGLNLEVTVIDPQTPGTKPEYASLKIIPPVKNLRETLYEYDLVFTHYGFTAFEALAAGCRVILFSPTLYHFRLGKAQGFTVLRPGSDFSRVVPKLLNKKISQPSIIGPDTVQTDLGIEFEKLAERTVRSCPFCGNNISANVIARYSDRTLSRCPDCGMIYLSFLLAGSQRYSRSYFFDEYCVQYGKTYLEDFDSIRLKGEERLTVLEKVLNRSFRPPVIPKKKLLDIGCAYGPFLAAANALGWNVTGTDISGEAVQYVRETLGFSAVVSAFPAPDAANSLSRHTFTAVTLWYVIEHFEDLESVLLRIRDLMISGGVLAFSTPSVAGVSGRFSRDTFYRNSPRDHYTLWDPRKVCNQLARYGFTVQKIVSTGHHPERFPFMKNSKAGSLSRKFLDLISRLFSLGDTFEVYAIKNGSAEDLE